jgi:carbamoyl-phosphate synthase large subunit
MKILTEASGSLTAAYVIEAIKRTGNIAVASDIDELNAGSCLGDDFILFPDKNDPDLWKKIERLLSDHEIDVVIPSLDEMMIGWAERKEYFTDKGISIIISPFETIKIFQNKWETFLFFRKFGIPCPATSLTQDHPLIKPIFGRGSQGIKITDKAVNMQNMISQEIVKGEEYTVDCFFDYEGNPVYIIPRKRVAVKEGKSTKGIVVRNDLIDFYVREIATHTKLIGPINMQCMLKNGCVKFIEVNPRIAGGMALGFAATENWVKLIIDNIINKNQIVPKQIKDHLKMVRYYAECFIP